MFKCLRLVLIDLIFLIGISLLVQSGSAEAVAEVSYSKYRFVFNDTARKDVLIMTNRGSSSVSCNAGLEHFIMGDNGPSKLATSAAEVSNSAEKLLRYAPRQANIAPNNSQVIRITSRRRPGIAEGEYLSYLKVSCQGIGQIQQEKETQITIKPQFVHYFPLQVRVGKITANTHFENVHINQSNGKYKILVDQYREGQRSIVGDIEVKDQTGTVLGMLKNIVIYPPVSKREHSIELKQAPEGDLEIIFTEDKTNLGSLITSIIVKP
jgi:hypothetical protein